MTVARPSISPNTVESAPFAATPRPFINFVVQPDCPGQVIAFTMRPIATGPIPVARHTTSSTTGHYDILGTSPPTDRGKRRAEFKMNSSSEQT